jgi:hypothetical protein
MNPGIFHEADGVSIRSLLSVLTGAIVLSTAPPAPGQIPSFPGALGFGSFSGGAAPANTSGDGIADHWKLAHSLSTNISHPLTNAINAGGPEFYRLQVP